MPEGLRKLEPGQQKRQQKPISLSRIHPAKTLTRQNINQFLSRIPKERRKFMEKIFELYLKAGTLHKKGINEKTYVEYTVHLTVLVEAAARYVERYSKDLSPQEKRFLRENVAGLAKRMSKEWKTYLDKEMKKIEQLASK